MKSAQTPHSADAVPGAPASAAVRRLARISVAIATPFDERDRIDWMAFTQHARGLLDADVASLTLFGTTGEGASVTQAERRDALEHLSDAGVSPGATIMTARGLAAEDIADDCRFALEAGCGAVLLAPPVTVGELDPAGVRRWYHAVFDYLRTHGAAARDIVLYNIPSVTGVPIPVDVVSALRRDFPEVVAGVKDSSGDWDYLQRLLAEHRDLAILASHEAYLARAIALGAAGTISGLANFQSALVADLAMGRDDERIDTLIDAILRVPPVPALKDLLAYASGHETWRRARPPLDQLPPSSRESLRATYDRLFPGTTDIRQ